MAALVAIETVVLALLTLLVAGLLRSHAAILRQLHDLGAGLDADAPPAGPGGRALTPAPAGAADGVDIAGTGIRDDAIALRTVGVEHRTLLAFLSSNCLTCRAFWDAFADSRSLGLPDDVRLAVITKDAAEEQPSVLARLAPAHLPTVMSSDAWQSYGVPGSPYFVLVDGPSGRVVGEGTGASWPQVLGLVLQSAGDAAHRGATTGDRDNAARIDRELLAAGIRPGDPTLYQTARDEPGAAPPATRS